MPVFTVHEAAVASGAFRGRLVLRRGYDSLVSGKRVLAVDDIVNTGLSLRQTVEGVRDAGGQMVGAACLVNRANVDASL
jgi:orotate phosphoribosyltransferase